MTSDQSEHTLSATEENIMKATHTALLKHGYADLSIARIGDELDGSKSSIYHYYDSKDDLLITLLEFTVNKFESTLDTEPSQNPAETLKQLIAKLLAPDPVEDDYQFQTVLVGFRSQAVTNSRICAQFTHVDERLADTIREILERGIAENVFEAVNASEVTEYILATIKGGIYTRVTTDRVDAVTATHSMLVSYIDSELIQDTV
ncbi:TetR/AcrR family transcriptional regulator [Halorubrum ezzemoulense]|uniref:TetR/AcrR family transcriptional regulator n=1 Tax=Halorubrum ezzemoulense TaxID=337243 RepID=A0ABT4Z850_HALEZ|nr:TetR/AcrR family transcriptional regulator [Halorubrum ezzemoulense]MDB2246439.1 TetR/AcrR family transcriptional regulator [Halorubrum ezzemoulense]MDB2280115.1 TetR/AcrR family transcriptional regulator [Halorubrum ezzemoulense]MDB2290484.1 TetR/AcrR family transcriptional regulator [Halorubrum ezzemoulense]MDB2293913.1 TetR/AcrR family transcriptional regulator [Halorubrum ezzemoulense]MDB2298008.1 TetR/AcrR family transcriptional regulator [Halorubrum ezzemoulense]